jgi:hypothetical protein
VSDDWFDTYAVGDFMPAQVLPSMLDANTADLVEKSYRWGYSDGAKDAAKEARDEWWNAYSQGVEDVVGRLGTVRPPRQRVRHLTRPGGCSPTARRSPGVRS